MYKTKDDAPHTPAYRKQVVDLYKIITHKFKKSSPYTKDDVIKAARAHLIHGTYTGAAKATGIGIDAIKGWANKDWWPILIEEINYLRNIETDGQFSNLISSALAEATDRIKNGDVVVVKGELKRKPVSARDAALVAAIAFDKRQVHRGDPTQISQQNFDVSERLAQLQDTFDELARRSEEKVIEHENEVGSLPHLNSDRVKEEAIEEAELIKEAIRLDGTDR